MSFLGLVTKKEAKRIAEEAALDAVEDFRGRLSYYRGLYVPYAWYEPYDHYSNVAFSDGETTITTKDIADYLGLEKVTKPEKTYLRKKK